MSKNQLIIVEGVVKTALPSAVFEVQINNTNITIIGHISGKIRKSRVKILPGDKVTMEFSKHDKTKGRIIRRK
ncbi:MAG: translation initiation factor IF-1 [Rickettsiaceae bacterium H1]|nr:translation initiation factor IF-1 [Rickettsiaceae bacterium H1]